MWPLHPEQGTLFNFGPLPLYENESIIDTLTDQSSLTTEITERSVEFISKNKDNPFFLYYPMILVHSPFVPTPASVEWSDNELRQKSEDRFFKDMVEYTDMIVKRLTEKIEELGLTKNTIFIFTADNGPEALDFGSTNMTVETASHGSPGPWRGTLFTGFEGALRVPFAMRWPGKIAAGTSSDEIVHAMDLYPTLAALAGAKVPEDRVIDGIDMSDFLLGKQTLSGREGFIVYMGKDIFGVKWRNWKLHFKEQEAWNSTMVTYTMPRVYNLYTDPQERDNVLFPNTWVPKAALGQLTDHMISLQQYPPIKTGQADPYKPE